MLMWDVDWVGRRGIEKVVVKVVSKAVQRGKYWAARTAGWMAIG